MLTSLNLDEAQAVPGVLDILTYQNTSELKETKFGVRCSTSVQYLGPRIFHAGQIIAVVLADSFEAASQAAESITATYSEEAPSATFGAQGLQEADATKQSEQHKHLPQAGDADGAIAQAEVAIDVEYSTPTQHHNPIELFTTTAVWTGDQLTVYEPSQFVYGLKNAQPLAHRRRRSDCLELFEALPVERHHAGLPA
jgi:xanthine dehydrogenase YagR molybdenum-binding subunit